MCSFALFVSVGKYFWSFSHLATLVDKRARQCGRDEKLDGMAAARRFIQYIAFSNEFSRCVFLTYAYVYVCVCLCVCMYACARARAFVRIYSCMCERCGVYVCVE